MNVMVEDKRAAFEPDSENTRLLRDAFGRFATGVTIVTAMTKDGPIAITATSFSSLSLTPALILWSPDKGSKRFPFFEAAQDYAIHVLAESQEEICWRIAKDGYGLKSEDYSLNAAGVPVLNDSLACFECKQRSVVDGGDHAIVVGEVMKATFDNTRKGICFFGGQMGEFVPKN